MFRLDISKISSNGGAGYITNPYSKPSETFVKQSFDFTPSLDRPATKSNFSEELLCGAPVKAENLDLWA